MRVSANSIIDILVVIAAVVSFGPLIGFMATYPFFSICIAALLQLLALSTTTLLSPSVLESKYSIFGLIRVLAAGAFLWLLAPLTNPVLGVPNSFQGIFFLLIIFGGVLAVNADLLAEEKLSSNKHIARLAPLSVGICILWAEALIMMYADQQLYPVAGIILFSALSYLPVRMYLAFRKAESLTSVASVVLAFIILSMHLS